MKQAKGLEKRVKRCDGISNRSRSAGYNYQDHQYIASLLADWRLQDKNGFEELEQLLRRELCMS